MSKYFRPPRARQAVVPLLILLCLSLVHAQAVAPYNGRGGKIEAFGRVSGTYLASFAFIEVCGEDPRYTRESEETARNYLNANQAVYLNLRKHLYAAAWQFGGDAERKRLQAEIADAIPVMEQQMREEAQKQVINPQSCASILANLRSGWMDLKTQRASEISIISTGN
jgi:hypothetical protein